MSPSSAQFGNLIYNPEIRLWQAFYGVARGNAIYSAIGPAYNSIYPEGTVALGPGPAGSWDDEDVNVPYVWYEAEEPRPWRMLYRGIGGGTKTRSAQVQIGLATAAPGSNGVINWQREDTLGKSLTAPVVPVASSGWAAQRSIDFGSLIKVDGVYYLYYSTISNPREIGLATSTNLVDWTPNPNNPLYQGVANTNSPDQGPDVSNPGVPAPNQGFFCSDIVYWPTSTDSSRYVMIAPHYSSYEYPSLDVFTCDSPIFLESSRHYLGKIIATQNSSYTVFGSKIGISGIDTPRIITDDISRNVATSTRTKGQVTMVSSLDVSLFGWLMVEFFWPG